MKVVEINSGAEAKIAVGEVLMDGLKEAGLSEETEARFLLVAETEDRVSFITNENNPAELVYLLEITKKQILGAN